MIVIVGLVILMVALLIGVAGVFADGGSNHVTDRAPLWMRPSLRSGRPQNLRSDAVQVRHPR